MAKIKKVSDNISEETKKITTEKSVEFGADEVFRETAPAETTAEVGESKAPEAVSQEIKDKIEKADLDDKLKAQAQAQADDVKNLDEQNKLSNLLQIAKQKGVVYAVHVAKKMNDPYLLDALHDILAKEGHYKEFIK